MWSKTTTTSTTTLNRVQLNVKTENTHLLCKGKITVWLTSCLTGLDSTVFLN